MGYYNGSSWPQIQAAVSRPRLQESSGENAIPRLQSVRNSTSWV
ncbi:unnamed protein product [Nippostrongylus brasiliensis]|uniref:Uncharacterized protein n=1 Tax=Nippostrongylus brasiliensis TaxID=27835 RepID=A0A0N4XN56_NIPBR|nr:unnamed protein product [Nippostrongylus brasiliensis]